jgi:tRNA threonylcarbamoyladenosine biosynthesis protein TsaE
VITRSEGETEALARELATELSAGDVVYLVGDLGAGKTTFARGLAAGLGAVASEVASPTFAILHEYAAPGGAVVLRHLDLYRLADRVSDLEILGLPDAVAGAPVAVEWPGEAIRAALPPTVRVSIAAEPGDARRISIHRASPPASSGVEGP